MRNNKKSIILTTLSIILGLGISLGAIYFIYHIHDERENNLSSGLISLKFTEGNNNIDLLTVPMIDDEGLKTNPYEFQLENTSAIPINAIIKLDLNNSTNIDLRAVRYAIFIDDKMVLKDYVHDNLILYEKENMLAGETVNVKVYFWVDYYYDKPGKVFSAKVVAEGKSIDAIATEPITVTLDPDGGTLATTTKEVYYHQYYGTLPTPTKEGYTFLGWNGKNLLNINVPQGYPNNTEFANSGLRQFVQGTHIKGIAANNYYSPSNIKSYNLYNESMNVTAVSGYGIGFPLLSEGGKTYSLSYTVSIDYTQDANYYPFSAISYYSNDGTHINYIKINDSGFKKQAFTTPNNTSTIVVIFASVSPTGIATFENILLEEGTTATEYEPYYITRDTKVVQNSNHTLKAIWKENE